MADSEDDTTSQPSALLQALLAGHPRAAQLTNIRTDAGTPTGNNTPRLSLGSAKKGTHGT